MGILDEIREQIKNYINIKDFFNLISYSTDESIGDVISYLVINNFESSIPSYTIDKHGRIYKSDHLYKFGFDLNIRLFIEDAEKIMPFEKYITYKNYNSLSQNFYLNKKELQSIDYIQSLHLDFNSIKKVDNAKREYIKEIENPISRYLKGSFDNPNSIQLELFKRDYLNSIEIACMLSGVEVRAIEMYRNHPKFTELYSDYISYKMMIDLAIQNGDIKAEYIPIIDPEYTVVKKTHLEVYLYQSGYILKGFNDWLNLEPAKPLSDYTSLKNHQNESDINKETDILSIILDETNSNHAPDLKHAINLWIDLYINGEIKDDSHSNRSNSWIKKNTGYSGNTSIQRIREITTPLKDFGGQRERES